MINISDIIGYLHWREAKTMKNIPHEYTVKSSDPALAKMYETLYRFIFDNHYIRYFYGKPYKYCDIGDFTYWIMTDDINESVIINRTKKGK